FIRQAVRDRTEIGHRILDQHVFCLTAIDGVAELPAAHRLEAVFGSRTILRTATAQTGIAVPARRDRARDHALAFGVTVDGGAELFDYADRFVTDRPAALHGILALEDMHVRSADRGRGDADQRT